ncbi:hypothetical protein Dxin01_01449 [Deinococcus xinjiangensis]|uniref:HTH arsR-type domain-containing protein n=1 Tax=Deinococcus xinjiangensis TaxID=457454 RepID=A0ABP9VBY5_9DEIO
MDVYSALADPTRRQMLDVLRGGEQPAMALVRQFPQLSRPAVLKHLGVLREAGLVTQRPQGRERLYRLNPAGLREVDDWLAHYRLFWTTALARLEAHLEETHDY